MSEFMNSLLAARKMPVVQNPRYRTGVAVLDEVFTQLGKSGLEAGVYLIGGDAGCGKSTFCLQLMSNLAEAGHIAAYCAYEGRSNIHGVLQRLRAQPIISVVDDAMPGWEPSTDILCQTMHQFAAENKTGLPLVMCIDSIKNLDSGSTAARREAIKKLHDTVHETHTILFIIAHATKDSQGKRVKKLEGPSELVGLADSVMYLVDTTPDDSRSPGVRHVSLDISAKNRFGLTGVFPGFVLRSSGFTWPVVAIGTKHAEIKRTAEWPSQKDLDTAFAEF